MTIKLGQRVTAPGRIFRNRNGKRRFWYRPNWTQKPITGIFIGVRTYANGTAVWDGEWGNEFTPDEYVKVGLIVTGTRTKPVPVMYEDITVME